MDETDDARTGLRGRAVFMVEAYRPPADEGGVRRIAVDGHTVVGVIDIPSDETVLYLVAVPDAGAAEHEVRARGVIPIRVVDARWAGDG